MAVGAVTGFVIGGGGSRIAMRLIALADDREDFGRITSAEAVVGEVTFGGTLDVLVKAGMLLGVVGALIYLGVRRWLPANPLLRTIAFVWVIVGVGLFVIVEGNADDFTFLDLGLSLGLFGATLLLFGLAVPPLVDRFAPPAVTRVGLATALLLVVASCAGVLAVARALNLAP